MILLFIKTKHITFDRSYTNNFIILNFFHSIEITTKTYCNIVVQS